MSSRQGGKQVVDVSGLSALSRAENVESAKRMEGNTRIMSNKGWANKGWFEGLVTF